MREPAPIFAASPFIARNANLTKGKTVSPKPIPKPKARPFLLWPSALMSPFNVILCPSTALVVVQAAETDPALPHPLALIVSTCNSTSDPP